MPSFVRFRREVEQAPKFLFDSAEVGEDLLLVSRMELFDGLEFHHHLPHDDQRPLLVLKPLRDFVAPGDPLSGSERPRLPGGRT